MISLRPTCGVAGYDILSGTDPRVCPGEGPVGITG
jgi:hypothetical protein